MSHTPFGERKRRRPRVRPLCSCMHRIRPALRFISLWQQRCTSSPSPSFLPESTDLPVATLYRRCVILSSRRGAAMMGPRHEGQHQWEQLLDIICNHSSSSCDGAGASARGAGAPVGGTALLPCTAAAAMRLRSVSGQGQGTVQSNLHMAAGQWSAVETITSRLVKNCAQLQCDGVTACQQEELMPQKGAELKQASLRPPHKAPPKPTRVSTRCWSRRRGGRAGPPRKHKSSDRCCCWTPAGSRRSCGCWA